MNKNSNEKSPENLRIRGFSQRRREKKEKNILEKQD
jgi:hypothetical protein